MSQQHEHDMEEEYIITIPDEDGNEVEMLLVDTFEVDSNRYAVLLEKEDLEADAVILRLTERDGDTYLEDIADDEEWAKVEEAYNQLVDEQEF
ncbi:DUF1292 domain-containing protein [Marinicrinis lubricantis]|uniref:DUF1292 domain-containing protein n=1 Tax=Marinicrinis lubricantis TaxID=2086470 RepID=A0ABW1IQI4_9BACL